MNLDILNSLCAGVFYVSETDSALEPFYFPERKDLLEDFQRTVHEGFDEKIERRTFDEFLSKVTIKRDWFGEFEENNRVAFEKISNYIKKNSSNQEIVRVGNKRIKIYMIGEKAYGEIFGIKFISIET